MNLESKICELCKQKFSPKYKVAKSYWSTRRFCSFQCSRQIGHPCSYKGKSVIPLDKRFWSKVDKRGDNECWIWIGGREKFGYGYLKKIGGGDLKAHRISWELHFGKIPKGLKILHKCDNPSCVNPNHLFIGTQKDNINDMITKGRNIIPRGEKHGNAIFNEKDIMEMFRLRKKGLTQQEIGNVFKVGQTTISSILLGKTWKHLTIS